MGVEYYVVQTRRHKGLVYVHWSSPAIMPRDEKAWHGSILDIL
ncbi:MAG: hypothetical protein OEY31_13770 [Candidatus Bathyarchaeota archaeon]|nr:hypothetical protein [Candidatus Bathyarchaeota archaeon]